MLLTKNNLNIVLFENHDARLLIEDIVTNTDTNIYYYTGTLLTLAHALRLWNKVHKENSAVKHPVRRYQTHQNSRTWIICESMIKL